jgi:outer membrane protein assembly factor BamD (BamD/ComL family)
MINRKGILVVLAAGVVLFAACQSKKEKLNAQIVEAEKQVMETYSAESINQLVMLYQKYAMKFPKDSLAAEYLYRSADYNMKLRKGEEALANLDAIIAKYPDNELVANCYFMKGFVYEDILYDIENAINAYYDFVAKFPSHKLALDASITISYLESGKTNNEIVASFNNSTTDSEE